MILNPEEFAGGGFNSDLLKKIEINSLKKRAGCNMLFKKVRKERYIGELECSKKCIIKRRDGSITYLVSNVDVSKNFLTAIDEGFDLTSNQKIWGSESGSIKFKRIE